MQRGVKILSFSLLLLAIWLPRGLALDQFVTPDEAAWVGRSAAFYHALAQRDFAQTYQHGHPGVTLTWAGTLAYRWRYPAMAWEVDQKVLKNWKNVEPFLEKEGIQPIEILATSRSLMVLGICVALVLAFIYTLRLIGFWPAMLGFALLAFDPFYIGLSRLLHLDGLVSSLMLLSLLVWLAFLYRGRHLFDLLLAGVAAGLSWLTRSPALFLGLLFGLTLVFELLEDWRSSNLLNLKRSWNTIWPILAWTAIAVLVFILLWPAMWVDPLGVLERMFGRAFSYAAEGHSSVIFFNGRIIEGDPGWSFYPISYLWRTTPIVVFGLGIAVAAFAFKWAYFEAPGVRRVALIFALFAVLFGLVMTLGAKKFDRYLLPSFLPLDLLAGMGWFALLQRIWTRWKSLPLRSAAVGVAVLLTGSQLLLTIQSYPYYLSYYNPLIGGTERAPEVMMIGWGEGLDRAARYLNEQPGAGQMQVMSHYSEGSFSYFFNGASLDLIDSWQGINAEKLEGVDYLVLYIHQWQRQRPDPALLAFFANQDPEYVVDINGMAYAQVYNLKDLHP